MLDFGVSYFECRRLKYVRRDMEELARLGFTYVVHTMSELDWELYGDTLRSLIRATHDSGLKAWLDPWAVGYVFGDDAYSHFVAAHPELAQRDQFGQPVAGACPNQPAFRKLMHQWIDKAMELDPDVLFWDEPHLYWSGFRGKQGRWGCYCPLCQSLYHDRFGEAMPQDQNDPSVRAFRDDTIIALLRDLFAYAHQSGAQNVLTLLPSPQGFSDSKPQFGPDWAVVAALDGLDGLGSDPYPFPADRNSPANLVPDWRTYVSSHAALTAELCKRYHLENHLWIQGFSIPADDAGYTNEAMALAVSQGINDLAVWGFDGHRAMSRLPANIRMKPGII